MVLQSLHAAIGARSEATVPHLAAGFSVNLARGRGTGSVAEALDLPTERDGATETVPG